MTWQLATQIGTALSYTGVPFAFYGLIGVYRKNLHASAIWAAVTFCSFYAVGDVFYAIGNWLKHDMTGFAASIIACAYFITIAWWIWKIFHKNRKRRRKLLAIAGAKTRAILQRMLEKLREAGRSPLPQGI